ncbi:MAG: hypothetical protein ACLVC1_00325 [Mediterraneibacter gnavus]
MQVLKLKFIYKGNKNVEALNIRTAEEIKALKRNLESSENKILLWSRQRKQRKWKNREEYYEFCKRNAKSKRIYGSKRQQEDEKRANVQHDLQQNRHEYKSLGEVLIHKEGGRTYEELETTDSIGVKRNDACITGRVQVPQHQKQIRKAGKIRQQKNTGGSGKESLEGEHMHLCSNLLGNSFGDL